MEEVLNCDAMPVSRREARFRGGLNRARQPSSPPMQFRALWMKRIPPVRCSVALKPEEPGTGSSSKSENHG